MRLSSRVYERIKEVEEKSTSAWERDDLRVARMVVDRAAKGEPEPWRASFITYFQGQPEKLIPFWVERERQNRLNLGPSLAEQLSDPSFLDNLKKSAGRVYSQSQMELPFLTEAREEWRAVMKGKVAA